MPAKESEPVTTAEDDLSWAELLRWVEYGCWTALALFPMLYWVNGPTVSTDQYVMRTILIVVASVGAVGLRLWHWRKVKAGAGTAPGVANVERDDSSTAR